MRIVMLGQVDYRPTLEAMQAFTAARQAHTADELWICEHPPTFTEGISSRSEHLLATTDIPIVKTDRGGQITYHGPGQVVAYPMVDLRRSGYFVKEYVFRIEEALIRSLGVWGVTGHRVRGAPGIYVRPEDPGAHGRLMPTSAGAAPDFSGLGKIAALGIKVSRHCTYHGVALNVNMDLAPFDLINPCGYAGLRTIDLSTIGLAVSWEEAAAQLAARLQNALSP
jgi:lipoyl(octanoyl) transferase